MKCKVLKGFIDKNTNEPYNANDVYDCTEKRFKEIQAKGNYLVAMPEKVAEKGNKKPEK